MHRGVIRHTLVELEITVALVRKMVTKGKNIFSASGAHVMVHNDIKCKATLILASL